MDRESRNTFTRTDVLTSTLPCSIVLTVRPRRGVWVGDLENTVVPGPHGGPFLSRTKLPSAMEAREEEREAGARSLVLAGGEEEEEEEEDVASLRRGQRPLKKEGMINNYCDHTHGKKQAT